MQQQQQQQHLHTGNVGGGIARPPPPEYKAAQAQLMHGMAMGQQPRFPNPPTMRRVAQQPMPASGNVIALIFSFFFLYTFYSV